MDKSPSSQKLNAAVAKIDEATRGPNPKIPGIVSLAVDSNGDSMLSHASGLTKLSGESPMAFDAVLWLASCTKLLTGIACMQLVEQGRVALDDASQLDKLAPELKERRVLTKGLGGRYALVPQERPITLRMLMTHTSGFGYAFDDLDLSDWARPVGIDDFSGRREDVLLRPLVFQPGTGFQYGASMDWVGVVVERVTGLSLEEYFQSHIFAPLGVKDIAFSPTREMKSRLSHMHQRAPDGSLSVTDHLLRHALVSDSASDEVFCMGGCGCFGTPREYSKILPVLLNKGTCPKTKTQLLKPETIERMLPGSLQYLAQLTSPTTQKEIFTDQIPQFPIPQNEPCPTAKPHLANPCPIIPKPGNPTNGWGLSFALSHEASETGRAAGAASWEGLANLYWFADRESGVAMIVAAQILPYGDHEFFKLAGEVERLVYESRGLGLRSSL